MLLLLLTSSLAWILQGNVGFDRAEITELRNLLQNESSMRKAAEEEIANLKSQLHQFTNPEVLDWLVHGFVEMMNCSWLCDKYLGVLGRWKFMHFRTSQNA